MAPSALASPLAPATQNPMGVSLLLLAGGVAVLAVLAMLMLRRWRRRIGSKRRCDRDEATPRIDPWREAGRRASPPAEEEMR